jgi:adenylate cyclase
LGINISVTRNRAQAISGVVLATFILCHFLNHALGLISVDTMEQGRQTLNVVWRSWPGTVLLYGALLSHFLLALDTIHRRQNLIMPPAETIKVFFGLALPFLLIGHVVGTRVTFSLTGYDKSYPDVLRALWASRFATIMQSAALVVAWTHGCLGMWFWLRGRPWFARLAPLFHMAAIAIPVLALMGFYIAAREVAAAPPPSPGYLPEAAILADMRVGIFSLLFALILGVLLIKVLPRRGRIRIEYPSGRAVTVNPGYSVLEASRVAGVPHVAVCGGRGRCSTCRVRVIKGLDDLPRPGERERTTLASIGAPRDIRLACQLRPDHDLSVVPLIDADGLAQGNPLQQEGSVASGEERQVVALFCDLRGFTRMAEQKLPYDVVFLLNRYFAMVGEAVEGAGGMVDKFIGDGAIGLFGLETSFEEACRQALVAAAKLSEGMETLNQFFSADLKAPLRIAMGLHGGPAIVGRIGYGKATSLTAVGDTINIASRLEGIAKQHDVELAVSAELIESAGIPLAGQESRELVIRGRSATLDTWMFRKATEVESLLKRTIPA